MRVRQLLDTGMGEARALRAAAFVLGICCGVQWVGATKRGEGKRRPTWRLARGCGALAAGAAGGVHAPQRWPHRRLRRGALWVGGRLRGQRSGACRGLGRGPLALRRVVEHRRGDAAAHSPRVVVWDIESATQYAVLGGFHAGGVAHVAFSHSGDLLATVGLDADHSVAVYVRSLLI